MQADHSRAELEEAGEPVLCIWDGSVSEKPESEQTEGLCAVRSAKAARLRKRRNQVWNPPGGKPITVLGMEWIGLLLVGMHGRPTVATMRWWSRKGEQASTQKAREKALLCKVAGRWGKKGLHLFDRGYGSGWWLQQLERLGVRFVTRWKKGHLFIDQQGQKKKLWEMARGKRTWGHKHVWDARKRCVCRMGVLALSIRHETHPGPLWLVVARRAEQSRAEQGRGPLVFSHHYPH